MPGFDRRIEHVAKLAQEYSVDGVIYTSLKFCDYGLFEAPVIETALKNPRLSFLVLENDYVWADSERVKTRIEAFVEMMRSEIN